MSENTADDKFDVTEDGKLVENKETEADFEEGLMPERLPVCYGNTSFVHRFLAHQPAPMQIVEKNGLGTVYRCEKCRATIRHHYKYEDEDTTT